MVFYGRVLYSRNRALRAVIDKGLYVTLHHDAIADMMMSEKRDAALAESDARMYAPVRGSVGARAAAVPRGGRLP